MLCPEYEPLPLPQQHHPSVLSGQALIYLVYYAETAGIKKS